MVLTFPIPGEMGDSVKRKSPFAARGSSQRVFPIHINYIKFL